MGFAGYTGSAAEAGVHRRILILTCWGHPLRCSTAAQAKLYHPGEFSLLLYIHEVSFRAED